MLAETAATLDTIKTQLKSAKDPSGSIQPDIYSHLNEVLNRIIQYHPYDALDRFEEISNLVKETNYTILDPQHDFEVNGKQSGFLRLPHSVHRSAYGWVPIPITTIKNGDGPTLLVMAGNHGNEYEGQIAISQLARELEAADIRGRLILLPMVNAPAAQAGLRTSPIDDGNLNRLFPGNASGGPTEMIADYLECRFMLVAE